MGLIIQTGIGTDGGVSPTGYIKIGEKSEKGYPRSLDYFKATSPNPEYVELFKRAFGSAPKSIEITFTGDDNDIDELFTCRNVQGALIETIRDASKLSVFAPFLENGQQFTVYKGNRYAVLQAGQFFKQTDDGWESIPMPTQDVLAKFAPPVVWKHEIVVNFRIPRTSRIDGLWQFRTGGVSTYAGLKILYLKAKEEYGQYFPDCVFDMNIHISKGNKNDRRFPIVTFACNFEKVKALAEHTFRRLATPKTLTLGASNQLQLPESNILETELENEDYTDELNAENARGR